MKETADLPLISVIVPAFNEEALLEDHVLKLCDYLESISDRYRSELLIINDGSSDSTGKMANSLAERHDRIRALHHPRNFGLGQTLKFGFVNTQGDYVVTLDIDLSYDVNHIGELVDKMRESNAKIVLASPYMRGGSVRNVPALRRVLSILGNKFLSIFAQGRFTTLTGMVRAYDGPFIRSLDLRSTGMDIMPETIYKALVLRASIAEIPGRLDWGAQNQYGAARMSSMRLMRQVLSTVLSGFVFRPFLFFIIPGLLIGAFAAYVDFWMFVHFLEAYEELSLKAGQSSFSNAFAIAYARHPHTFVTALLATMLAAQLIGLGVITLQAKRYFEDLFHQGSTSLKELRRPVD